MKHLPKHLQPRWRYLGVAIESWPDAEMDRRGLQRQVWYAAQNLLGDTGSAAVDLTVLRFEFADGSGNAIVRTRRGETERARAALTCLTDVDGHPVSIRVRGITGTVRACEEKYIGRGGEPSEQRHVVFEDSEREAIVRGDRVDVRIDDGFSGATELDFQ